mmetsp:Transcript_38332/g.46271  ORF Transcript_38332/g.46271 Transcript_38332/m.46271 type:complete len:311 (+) Transcript_38332:137-1069(+)
MKGFEVATFIFTVSIINVVLVDSFTTLTHVSVYRATNNNEFRRPFTVNEPPTKLFSSTDETPPPPSKRSQNEFSRVYTSDQILRPNKGSSRARKQRDLEVSIAAENEELSKLALRFDLPDIASLKADVKLKRDTTNSERGVDSISADGTMYVTVTQRCARTNEKFVSDLEIPLHAIAREVETDQPINDDWEEDVLKSNGEGKDTGFERKNSSSGFGDNSKKGKNKKRKKRRDDKFSASNLNEMDMEELQNLIMEEEARYGDVEIFEEPNIFTNGVLDVGEMVAQCFLGSLDPFPKKPGTKPVNIVYGDIN